MCRQVSRCMSRRSNQARDVGKCLTAMTMLYVCTGSLGTVSSDVVTANGELRGFQVAAWLHMYII